MLSKTGFDLWAENYDQSVAEAKGYPFEGYYDVLDYVFNRIKCNNPEPKILDLGFGTGTLTYRLYKHGSKIYGIDFSINMINLAKSKMPDSFLIEADFSKGLPVEVKDKTFDFVVSTYAIHHLDNDQKVDLLGELKNLLNPGGKIIIGDVSFKTTLDLVKCKLEDNGQWDDDEIYIVFEEFEDLLRKRGFNCTYTQLSNCAGVLIID